MIKSFKEIRGNLVKAMSKEGLVQREVQVTNSKGTSFTRKQWVRVDENGNIIDKNPKVTAKDEKKFTNKFIGKVIFSGTHDKFGRIVRIKTEESDNRKYALTCKGSDGSTFHTLITKGNLEAFVENGAKKGKGNDEYQKLIGSKEESVAAKTNKADKADKTKAKADKTNKADKADKTNKAKADKADKTKAKADKTNKADKADKTNKAKADKTNKAKADKTNKAKADKAGVPRKDTSKLSKEKQEEANKHKNDDTSFKQPRFDAIFSEEGKEGAMAYLKQCDITWNESEHEGVNWMRASMAAKKAGVAVPSAAKAKASKKPTSENAEQTILSNLEQIMSKLGVHGTEELEKLNDERYINKKVFEPARKLMESGGMKRDYNKDYLSLSTKIGGTQAKHEVLSKIKQDLESVKGTASRNDGSTSKAKVQELVKQHGKDKVMEMAKKSGVSWNENSHKGVNWMRASMAIREHLDNGGSMFSRNDGNPREHQFKLGDEVQFGKDGRTGKIVKMGMHSTISGQPMYKITTGEDWEHAHWVGEDEMKLVQNKNKPEKKRETLSEKWAKRVGDYHTIHMEEHEYSFNPEDALNQFLSKDNFTDKIEKVKDLGGGTYLAILTGGSLCKKLGASRVEVDLRKQTRKFGPGYKDVIKLQGYQGYKK